MKFDFTNYTFSGLLSILASLYGVGYPLIVQSISRIFNQFNSALLSQRFSKEPIYKLFQILMIANMVIAIVAPFVLQAGWMNQIMITIQAIFIVVLIGCSFMLFRLILVYSNAEELLKRVEGKQIDKNNVMELLDLAIYADAQHNMDLYYKSMHSVFAYISYQQDYQPNQVNDTVSSPIVYDETTISIVMKIKEFIRIDDGHHFLYGNNDITSVFYNQTSNTRIHLQAHKLVWMLVNDAVEFGNHSWFNQYWQYADSYASLKYRFLKYDSPLRNDSQIFMIRHVMIGGMILHYGRTSWLNDVLFFTHSLPEYYGLIPSSFVEIVIMLELIEKMCDNFNSHYFNQQGLYYHDQTSGVKDNKYFFRDALKYLSLLVIRLWSLEGRGFSKADLFGMPASPLKLKDDERDAQMMEMMQQEVNLWFDGDVFSVIPRLKKVKQRDVLDILEKYQSQCENDMKEKENHPTVDSLKYQKLKQGLEEEAESLDSLLPNPGRYSAGKNISIIIYQQHDLETINYSGYLDIDCSNLPEGFFRSFRYEIADAYVRCLCKQKRLGDFRVPRKQIPNVLRLMKINDKYAIISMEKIAELGETTIVLDALYNVKMFFVVEKSELPKSQLLPVEKTDFSPIKEGSSICSNIDLFQSCTIPIFNFDLTAKFNFSIPNTFSGYVRFTVDENYLTQDVNLNLKKTFDELFLKAKTDTE